jgi:hypothetical protein
VAAGLLVLVGIPLLKIVHRVLEERMDSEDCTANDRAHRLSQQSLSYNGHGSRKGGKIRYALAGLEDQDDDAGLKRDLLQGGHVAGAEAVTGGGLADPVAGKKEAVPEAERQKLGRISRFFIQSEINIVNALVSCGILEYKHAASGAPSESAHACVSGQGLSM